MINLNHLLIRADASSKIGMGHIMRCFALAQAWKNKGGVATFISCCESNRLRKRIESEGFGFFLLEKAHPDPSDLENILNMLERLKTQKSSIVNRQSSIKSPRLVLDGYHFDSFYQKSIMEAGYPLLVIDDMGHLPFYYADLIVNQNVYAGRIPYNCAKGTELLLGNRYLLMREEFTKWRNRKRIIPETAQKVLITMGGADSKNVIHKVMHALLHLKGHGLEIKLIIGPGNSNDRSVEDAKRETGYRIEILRDVKNMPELMAWADIAVSAGGSTCWEMAFMGLPNLIIILATNQRLGAEALELNGCSKNLGHHQELSHRKIAHELLNILGNREARKAMSDAGRRLIDGSGVDRVLDKLNTVGSANRRLIQ